MFIIIFFVKSYVLTFFAFINLWNFGFFLEKYYHCYHSYIENLENFRSKFLKSKKKLW